MGGRGRGRSDVGLLVIDLHPRLRQRPSMRPKASALAADAPFMGRVPGPAALRQTHDCGAFALLFWRTSF